MVVPLTTIEFLDGAVDIYGDETGVIADDGTEYTYRQFNERVNRLSHALSDFGLEYGDRVAVLSYNTHWMLESFYGTNQLGIINVPMIYTTNWVEWLNKSFRRSTKIRNALPSPDAALLLLSKVAVDQEESKFGCPI